jgi:lauroyl/myristoyl acyltransferase
MKYTVSVSDWSEPRGYRNSGRGYRVRCFGLPDDNWNAMGQTVFEQFFRTESAAAKAAASLAKQWNADVQGLD